MIDIYLIRDPDTFEKVKNSEKHRFKDTSVLDQLKSLESNERKLSAQLNELRSKINKLNKEIKKSYQNKDASANRVSLIAEKKDLEDSLAPLEQEHSSIKDKTTALMKGIGNLLDERVPIGPNDDSNVIVTSYPEEDLEALSIFKNPSDKTTDSTPEGTIKRALAKLNSLGLPIYETVKNSAVVSMSELTLGTQSQAEILPHEEIMVRVGGLETAAGSMIAGHRGYFLRDDLFLLASALSQYALHFLVSRGYSPVQPPYFMKKSYITKTCQLSDLDEGLYSLDSVQASGTEDEKEGGKEEEKVLIATSEQPLSCLFIGGHYALNAKELPVRLAGYSSCFRKEAGSHGKDIRGIFRVHQFEKVEQFIYSRPEDSEKELQGMVGLAEEFLKSLGIPFRTVLIASGELNDAAAIKYDIEGFFPGQGQYRELMSCSNCTDYQSREIGVKARSNKEKFLPHLLNGTLCAVQRTLCCLVENWQAEEGVRVPEVLNRYWLGSKKIIKYRKKQA